MENKKEFTLILNEKSFVVSASPDTPLLYILRNDAALNGPKFGCGLSQCGACTVIMDGSAIRSCVMPIEAANGKNITTLDGLGGVDNPSSIQKAFIDEQAAQCGYCSNGMIMASKALLDKNPQPTESDIKEALEGNICRCGSHQRIIKAVKRAALNEGL